MADYSADSVKIQTFELVKSVAFSYLSDEHVVELNATIPWETLLDYGKKSENLWAKEFTRSIESDFKEITSLIDSLTPPQLPEFSNLLQDYKESFEAIQCLKPQLKEEFCLTFSFNVVRDLENYKEDERKLRKKRDEYLSLEVLTEVDENPPQQFYGATNNNLEKLSCLM